MSPRPYRLGRRQVATDQTRARIIAAARELLMAEQGISGFSIDAVARQAGVARMTVYYQYGSKTGLLNALFDDLAARGGLEQLGSAFTQPDPLEALTTLIGIFARFWAADRLIERRLRGLAVLDPDLEGALRTRGERRRYGLRAIVTRIAQQHGYPTSERLEEAVDALFTIGSFEFYDGLAIGARTPEETGALMQRLARAALESYR
jgi:AcrR family transcriptional regulator